MAIPAKADITTGLQLWYTLDQTNGLTAVDNSGNGNNGTLNNFPTDSSYLVTGIITNAFSLNNPTNVTPFTNEYIYAADVPGLNFTTNLTYTISCWVNCNSGAAGIVNTEPSGAGILDKGPGRQQEYTFDMNLGLLRFYSYNSTGGTSFGPSSTIKLTNGVWYHVCGVYSGSTTPKFMTLYINGVVNSNFPVASIQGSLYLTTNGVNIGSRQSAVGSAYNQSFKGAIDDVRIYNRALTASDVQQLYQISFVPPTILTQPKPLARYVNDPAFFSVSANSSGTTSYQWRLNGVNVAGATSSLFTLNSVQSTNAGNYTVVITNAFGAVTSAPVTLTVNALPPVATNVNLVAYYKLDETSGFTASDSSSNGNSGQLILFSNDPAQWVPGIINNALQFNADNSGQNVLCVPGFNTPDNGVFDFSTNAAYTLSCWVQSVGTEPPSVGIIAKGFGNGGEEYAMDIQQGPGTYRIIMRDANLVSYPLITSVQPNGSWQHLACVYNATNSIFYYYINGVLSTWTNVVPASMLSSTHELSIGNRQAASAAYNDPWSGKIDDVHIYSRDLTSAEIQALYYENAVAPIVQTPPQSISRYNNDPAIFTVVLNSTTTFPVGYQWLFNGTPIAGATNSYLTLNNVFATNAGNYTVAITNVVGSVTSAPGVLSVSALPTPQLSSNLLVYYKFDETSGYVAADSSPNGNNGQLANFSNDPAEWVAGIINGALQFNADNTYADVVATPGVGTSDNGLYDFSTNGAFTLACWVKGGAQTNGCGIIAKGTGAGGEEYAIDTVGGVYRFYVRDANTNSQGIQLQFGPNNGWQHLVGTYNAINGIMSFYVNGQLYGYYVNVYNGLGSIPRIAPTSLLANQHELSVGNRQSTATSAYNLGWTGLMDDVRIYNRDLNAGEVSQLFYSVAASSPVRLAGASIGSPSGGAAAAPFQITGSGPANVPFRLYSSSSLSLPFAQWTLINTSSFDAIGHFTYTDNSATGSPSSFYRVSIP